MPWTLVPLVELPFLETVPVPADWHDPRQRDLWVRARAEALAVPFEDLVGSGFVPADRLTVEAWRRMLAATRTGDVDELHIDGGLGLYADGDPVLLPQCCIWIDEAIVDWTEALDLPEDEWTMLWIGHPWVMVRRTGDVLTLSHPTESNNAEDFVTLADIPLPELRAAIDQARTDARTALPLLADALASHGAAESALGLGR